VCTDGEPATTVVVPLLLSTGYHVRVDIPGAVRGRTDVVVARHLGPHALLTDALLDRLGELAPGDAVVLAAAGSRQPEAAAELAEAASLLASRLGAPVPVLTMGEPLAARLTELAAPGRRPIRVATYLLTEGQFVDALASAAPGHAEVAPPLGTHPAVVALVWLRYADAVGIPGR
jgi:sirohydrochlorin ferrochelatase